MNKVTLIARILLGITFVTFGLNGFYTFIPVPKFHPFMEILVSSGFIYFEKGLEVIAGALLLFNRYILAALLILGPIVINIFLYHILLDYRNWPVSIIILLLYAILIKKHWSYFKIFTKAKVD
ncbi:hypothetical protein [Sporocytophaga myxococcoides]|uniref:hypothetical protein n=1 Tax=Sporocytophaga myxococcoides TaxID=153721 RepID=UPI0006885535|nr:hypothetical protein [Sporocytophaga myxococcoides]